MKRVPGQKYNIASVDVIAVVAHLCTLDTDEDVRCHFYALNDCSKKGCSSNANEVGVMFLTPEKYIAMRFMGKINESANA